MTIVPSQRWAGDTKYTAKLVINAASIPTRFFAYKADTDYPATTNLDETIPLNIPIRRSSNHGVPTIIRINSSQREQFLSQIPQAVLQVEQVDRDSEAFLVEGVWKGGSQQQVNRGIISAETWYIVGRTIAESGDLEQQLDLSPPIVEGQSFTNRYRPTLSGKNFNPRGYPNTRPYFQVEFRFPNGVTKRAEISTFRGRREEERSPLEPEITVEDLEYWQSYDTESFTSRALNAFEENFYKTQKWSHLYPASGLDTISLLNEKIDEFFMVTIHNGVRKYVNFLEKGLDMYWISGAPRKAELFKRPDGTLFYKVINLSKDKDELNLLS